MSSQLHQQVKEIFSEICELPRSEQQKTLERLQATQPEVASELKSLLQYHTQQSLVVESPSPKVRTRSTLSKTYLSRPSLWLRLLARALLYAIPLALAGTLISYWTNHRIHSLLHSSVAAQLEDLIDQRLQQYRQWEVQQIELVTGWSRDQLIQSQLNELLKLSEESFRERESNSSSQLSHAHFANQISERLRLLAAGETRFVVWDRRMTTIASSNQVSEPELIGNFVTPAGASILSEVFRGSPRICLPGLNDTILDEPPSVVDRHRLLVFLPIFDDVSQVVAVFMVSSQGIDNSYEKLFEKWYKLQSSETYLVNERGVMLTHSRYGETLAQLDLATAVLDSKPAFLVRDPGVNLLAGDKPEYNPLAWPLTLSARQVTSGNGGMSTDGYRNYVGFEVVGAWRWLADRKVGLILEQHADDAFAIANTARKAIIAMASLFGFAIAIVGVVSASRHRNGMMRDISDVGPYKIQEMLGEGGMGRVYLAEHALLCRQSAVKLLSGNDIDLNVISRFEREVQLASQLTHPNTIAIYDFGRDREGRFYYAMEYIHGAHLGQLVEYCGAIHPGRTIFLLRQLCRALSEAHQAGVVHRDIKPQNIMVCNRGGEPDFVKLFDYGLVKAFAPGVSHGTTSQTKVVVGTPRFMAPERLNSPWLADPRVDIYSVGAVAYYLLTGKLPPLFTSSGPTSHEQPGIETLDLPAGAVEFGELLGMCLSPEPSDRPSSMLGLLRELEELSEKFPWSREDSVVWWQNHEGKLLKLVKNRRQSLELGAKPVLKKQSS